MIKKTLLNFVFLTFLTIIVYSDINKFNEDEIKNNLLGVWFFEEDSPFIPFNSIKSSTYSQTYIDTFSWGKSVNIAYHALSIDYVKNKLTFNKSPGDFIVKDISSKMGSNNIIFDVTVYFDSGIVLPENKIEYVKLTIKIKDREMIISNGSKTFSGKYYKIGGPNLYLFKTYYITVVNDLRLRDNFDINSKIIRNLKKGEKLELLERGKIEEINGTKGAWVKVKTEKGETGWAFDAYLEEVKKN